MDIRNFFAAGGKRASDHPTPAPAAPSRDRQLEEAIAGGEIAILFQPQIDPASGRVAGAEALARWAGALSAEALFGRAAAAGLSERLSRVVQRQAIRAAAAWSGPLAGLGLSINLLPQDVGRRGYAAWLLGEVAAAGLDPLRLTAEITESALVDPAATVRCLARLRAAGISIAVDDFGTGYASLAYLTSLPLDMLKIDRGLVTEIVGGERDRIVVRAMIRLARELNLRVLVAGVETVEQLALLAAWGCDLYQGFLGAGPLGERELARFVATSNAAADIPPGCRLESGPRAFDVVPAE